MPDFIPSRFSARTAMALMLGTPLFALAQSTPTSPQPFIQDQRQQERERALREQNERTVDERLPAAPVAALQRIPDNESPCFLINHITLVGEQCGHRRGHWLFGIGRL